MELPGAELAVVDIVKLRDYCLNPSHYKGRHKARVFAAALSLTQSHAEFPREELLRVAREGDAVEGNADGYGRRYILDLELALNGRHAVVRSAWIIRHGERFPRLTSCFVLSK